MKLYKSFIFHYLALLSVLTLIFPSFALESQNIELINITRNKSIPIEVYYGEIRSNLPLVIINHGYGIKNTEYSFIANFLAEQGYHVVSIEHIFETNETSSKIDNLFQRRKPIWEDGVKNILFVLSELNKQKIGLNTDQIILIGHSNGGDIAMMFAELYPNIISKIISLDSLRYPFSMNEKIPILHFGAIDTKADKNIVASKGIKTILIRNARHVDLCDRGSHYIKKEIIKSISQFLK